MTQVLGIRLYKTKSPGGRTGRQRQRPGRYPLKQKAMGHFAGASHLVAWHCCRHPQAHDFLFFREAVRNPNICFLVPVLKHKIHPGLYNGVWGWRLK